MKPTYSTLYKWWLFSLCKWPFTPILELLGALLSAAWTITVAAFRVAMIPLWPAIIALVLLAPEGRRAAEIGMREDGEK